MAKVGQEDDRWIVNDLGEQGKNVNNWHWTEQNVMPWLKDKILTTFTNLVVIDKDKLNCMITSVTPSGEATIYNRKGKLRAFYEVEITMKWSGKMTDGDGKIVGKIEDGQITVSTLTDDIPLDDLTINFPDVKDADDHAQRIHRLMKKSGQEVVKEQLLLILAELRNGGKFANGSQPDSTESSPCVKKMEIFKTEIKIPTSQVVTEKFIVIKLKDNFAAPPKEVYECFVDTNRIQFYTRSGAKMGRNQGDEFILFNGSVKGSIVEIVPGNKIVLQWRFSDWKEGHFSTVTILFEGIKSTNLTLTQENIPKDEKEKVTQGWEKNFFHAIKTVFNF